ncbi:MAG: response regulator [Flavobacteriales bacterium]|jgi:CheY-like chemotaxis protein|nr:response regulator [Flavobacteriales bacterium]
MSVKIIIAEDELIIAKANATMLTKLGYEVEVVKNAADVISAVKTFNPALILMDIHFRKDQATGIDAAIEIRKNNNVPIIFTSGNKPDSIGEISNVEHLTKPVNINLLKQKIIEYTS